MKFQLKHAAIFYFSILLSHLSFAETPEDVAQAYFNAMQSEGMTSIGRFMHPQALDQFKRMLLPVYQFEAGTGGRDLINMTFGAESNIDKLTTMVPEDFMNGFMNIVAAQMGTTQLSFDKLEILGTVAEKEDRHVLTRITIGADELSVTQFEVLSFKPFQDTWRLQLNGEMQGIVNQLRASIPQ